MAKPLARIILLLIAGFTALLGYYAYNVEFDYDFEKFYPKEDSDTEFFNEYRNRFASDNDFLLIGIDNQKSVFTERSISQFKQLTEDLKTVENVNQVVSVFSIPGGFFTDSIPDLKADSARIFKLRQLTEPFIDDKSQSMCIVLLHKEYLSKEGCDNLVHDVSNVLEKYDFSKTHLAGRSIAQLYYMEISQRELKLFISLGAIVLIIVLFFTFRTVWGVAVPLIVVLLSMLWTVGLMALFGQPFNLLLTILPTIVFIVGVSDVIHIVSKYLDLLREGEEKINAIIKAFKEVGLATLLTSITTAVGFLTLIIAKIEPIQHFGMYSALGVMVAYVLAFTVLPSILVLSPKPQNKAVQIGGRFWKTYLNKLLYFVIKQKRYVIASTVLLFLLSLYGISKIEVNNFVLDDVKESNTMRKDFGFFEQNFSGVRPFEMQVDVVDASKTVFSKEVLREIEKLEEYLTNNYEVSSLVSPTSIVKVANYNMELGADDSFEVPSSKRKLKQIEKAVASSKESKAFVTADLKQSRISGRAKDLGSKVFRVKTENLNKFIEENINPELIKLKLTGSAELIDKNNKGLSVSLLQGLIIAFIVVVLIVGLIFKSLKMVLISLVPNVLPLVFIGGLIGFLGVDIKVSTSIVFTIAFGIAVDDTLHFLNKLKIELSRGKPLAIALRRTFISSGKAIIITTIVLCSGFISLIGSSFLGTMYVGILVSVTLFLAVICDLFLLPILILKFYKN
jgi:predicted RND superfamily exporter protein